MTPPISVIVPVFDVAGHVGASIASLRAQAWRDFEAIVVDDGSTDDSLAQARAAAAGDGRFRFIAQPNRGLSAARNAGLDAARGDFVAFLDGDDRYAPGFLARLHGALRDSGADWAACAIRNVWPDGAFLDHSAIHGAPDPAAHGPRLWPLDDWREALRHFPSAWNKLYRRRLIEGLRFDEGTWFEDHAFFQRAACRTDRLMHLPEPLYLQTRGRAGQITAADSDRAFEQFAVLDRLRGILDGSGRTGAAEGFSRLAARLVHERSTALRNPARRARFLAAARACLARHRLSWEPGPELATGRTLGLALSGQTPVSVVIAAEDGPSTALAATLQALAAQDMPDFETILVHPPGTSAPEAPALPGLRPLEAPAPGRDAARNAGLAAARGAYVTFLDPGDLPARQSLGVWVEGLLREGAEFGFSGFEVGNWARGHYHPGLHGANGPSGGVQALPPDRVLDLHPGTAGKVFARPLLSGLRFRPGPLSDWEVTLAAALKARSGVYFGFPTLAVPARPLPGPWALWRAAQALAPEGAECRRAPERAARLPEGWREQMFLRAVALGWDGLREAGWRQRGRGYGFLLAAAAVARWHRPGRRPARIDPDMGPRLRRLLGLPKPGD